MNNDYVESLLKSAIKEGVQDIYIIPRQHRYDIYYRIEEERSMIDQIPFDSGAKVISHLKFVAGMMVGEKRRSQLATCDYQLDTGVVGLRLSTLCDCNHKESMVLRIMSLTKELISKDSSGVYNHYCLNDYIFSGDKHLSELKDVIKHNGIYVIMGEAGIGKTTLANLLLTEVKEHMVMTIEDSVEIRNDDFIQLVVNPAIGMTYDSLVNLCCRYHSGYVFIGVTNTKEQLEAVKKAFYAGLTVVTTTNDSRLRLFEGVPHTDLLLERTPGNGRKVQLNKGGKL
ncbi:ATPase, T2SS/T4P/T4SS family [Streptococcus salivarius]|jgi:competence protein cglA|uniref:ATPase, T2SS/T4P/T4SS family n=1 Tax=Streptococcus salivarius TaxID=1304 RepID=UPI00352D78CC